VEIFEEKVFLQVHHLDLNKFLSDLCGKPYDTAEGLDFPSNGTMHEIDIQDPDDGIIDPDELRDARAWLDGERGGPGETPDLTALLEVLAEQGKIRRANYLIDVWW
jgi:hypothetical protein